LVGNVTTGEPLVECSRVVLYDVGLATDIPHSRAVGWPPAH
jgi:hypothetical protein